METAEGTGNKNWQSLQPEEGDEGNASRYNRLGENNQLLPRGADDERGGRAPSLERRLEPVVLAFKFV